LDAPFDLIWFYLDVHIPSYRCGDNISRPSIIKDYPLLDNMQPRTNPTELQAELGRRILSLCITWMKLT